MTLGWHVGSMDGASFYYKEGGGAGFHCMMRLYPHSRIATVVMTNATRFDVSECLNLLDRTFVRTE
jgi:D-alanyl-D-alanine carboxypeptidase